MKFTFWAVQALSVVIVHAYHLSSTGSRRPRTNAFIVSRPMLGGSSYLDSLQSPNDNESNNESNNKDPSFFANMREPTVSNFRPEEITPLSAFRPLSPKDDDTVWTVPDALDALAQETEINLFHITSFAKLPKLLEENDDHEKEKEQELVPMFVGTAVEVNKEQIVGMTTTTTTTTTTKMMSTPPFNNNDDQGPRQPRSFDNTNNGRNNNNNGPPPGWEPRGGPPNSNSNNNNGPPPGWDRRGSGPPRNMNDGPSLQDPRRPDNNNNNVNDNTMRGGWNPAAVPQEKEVDPMAAYLAASGQMKPPLQPTNNGPPPRVMQPQNMQAPPSIRNGDPPRSFSPPPESGRRPMEKPPPRNDGSPRSFTPPQSNNMPPPEAGRRPMEMPPARGEGPPRSSFSPPPQAYNMPPESGRRPVEMPPARNDGPPRSFTPPQSNNMPPPESGPRPMEMPPARKEGPPRSFTPPQSNNMPPPESVRRPMEMPPARSDGPPRSFTPPQTTGPGRSMEMPAARNVGMSKSEGSPKAQTPTPNFTPRPPTQKPFFAADELDKQVDDAVSNAMDAIKVAGSRNPSDSSNNFMNKKTLLSQESLIQDINESTEKLSGEWNDLLKSFTEPFTSILPPPTQFEKPPPPKYQVKGMTERIMRRIPSEQQASGAGGSSSWEAFQRSESLWSQLKEFQPFTYDPKYMGRPDRNGNPPPQMFVYQDIAMGNPNCWLKLREQYGKDLDFDIVVCGGTLGIFFATALQLQGHRVCVVEAGELRGREQEWNLSFDELYELVEMGVLTEDDVDDAIQTEFPGCRSGFKNKEVTPLEGGYMDNKVGYECFTSDVLNLGVAPTILLQRAAKTFAENGGVIRDRTRMSGVAISETIGAAVDIGEDKEPITARLVIDCMGNGSPISRQQRHGQKPDGVCVVVGSCASGYDPETNVIGDLIYTNQVIADKGENGRQQYFWEAFPVGIGHNGKQSGTSDVKTTYMFTYLDADSSRPSLESIMEDYWSLLPVYQPSIENPEEDLDFKRVLFAYFPTYRDSPLKPQWNRVLAVGDASGIQSPLSFGGFGALTRHLSRITGAVTEALELDLLHKDDLGAINAYTPNLSATWMFQKAMSVKPGQKTDADFVNRLLAVNFEVMDQMGKRTIKPFLQDVVRFDGLVSSLGRCFVADPAFMPKIIAHVGIPQLVDWVGHVSMMGLYTALHNVGTPIVKPVVRKYVKDEREQYLWRRRMEAWKYGSGSDYELPDEN